MTDRNVSSYETRAGLRSAAAFPYCRIEMDGRMLIKFKLDKNKSKINGNLKLTMKKSKWKSK